jgi:hypothetical protein
MVAFSLFLLEHARYHFIPTVHPPGSMEKAERDKSSEHPFWLLDGFVILIQRRPVGLSSYGLSTLFATLPANLGSQVNSCFARKHAGPDG